MIRVPFRLTSVLSSRRIFSGYLQFVYEIHSLGGHEHPAGCLAHVFLRVFPPYCTLTLPSCTFDDFSTSVSWIAGGKDALRVYVCAPFGVWEYQARKDAA